MHAAKMLEADDRLRYEYLYEVFDIAVEVTSDTAISENSIPIQ
jgi:hypothetical protein